MKAERERIEAEGRAKRDKEAAAAAHAEAERIKQLQVWSCPTAQTGPFCWALLGRAAKPALNRCSASSSAEV